jgi:hypothetical protein
LIRFLEKEPRIRFVGFVTGGAGAYGDRAVEELPLEFCRVVTTKAESILVFAHIQKVPAFPAVGIVACQAVTLLYRRVDIFLLPFGVMTLAAECRALGRQFKALLPLNGMFLYLLLVAGETVPLFDGGVGIL